MTWLYGPLHTAVEWTPPPRPEPVPDSVDCGNPASTHDRLDLHSASSRHSRLLRTKPILKHRSISELLTSDLPVSPIFSPQESEDESNQAPSLFSGPEEDASNNDTTDTSKRPGLVHTKSDTHVTRWGPSRAFRKDSPPRVQPPTTSVGSSSRQSTSTVRASGAVRSSLSQDSNSSASGSSERATKKKHITFNTFVEQCIAIDKHPRQSSRRKGGFGFGDYVDYGMAEYHNDEEEEDDERWDDDDGYVVFLVVPSLTSEFLFLLFSYEEDREDNFFEEEDPVWTAAHGGARPRRRHLNGSAIHSDSDSDDGVIEIRPSSYRHSNQATPSAKRKAPPRSKSASSSSSTTTSSTSTSSAGTPVRQRRKSASAENSIPPSHLLSVPPPTSAYRPRPIHLSHSDPPYRDHVTIAPIAPTLLKTTGAWEEGFGDEGGASDDGLWDYGVPRHGVNGRSSSKNGRNKQGVGGRQEDEPGSDGTPVELVYVPPFGSIYGYGAATYWRNRGVVGEDGEGETEEIEGLEEPKTQPTNSSKDDIPEKTSPTKESLTHSPTTSSTSPSAVLAQPVSRSPIPVVVVDLDAGPSQPKASISVDQTESGSNSSNSTSTTTTPVPVPSGGRQLLEEERSQGRGRSVSISPIGANGSSKSNSGASSGQLTSRGRSQSYQDLQSFHGNPVVNASLQAGERRGRLSMRGSSNSNSSSLRGYSSRSCQSNSGGANGGSGSVSPNVNLSSSPMGGSLSPDGSDTRLGGIGCAYAGGRMGGRERERIERVSSSSSLSSRGTVGGSDERRGRDRGRRDIGSGSGSSTSPIAGAASPSEETRGRGRSENRRASLSPQEVFETEPVSSAPATVVAAGKDENGKEKESRVRAETRINNPSSPIAQKGEMDASICSASSESSTVTIVPASSMVVSTPQPATTIVIDVPPASDNDKERQLEREAMEEAEIWRKTIPTPSSSPMISMAIPRADQSEVSTTRAPLPPPAIPSFQVQTPLYPLGHVRTASASSTHSQSTASSKPKTKPPPPIVPSPPHPSLPSTSPSYAPGEVSPSVAFAGFGGMNRRSASTSLERASSGSRERNSPSTSSGAASQGSGLRMEITANMEQERQLAEARRGRNNIPSGEGIVANTDASANGGADAGMGLEEPVSPRERETILDKAVGMVSTAGAYFRLWPNYGGGA